MSGVKIQEVWILTEELNSYDQHGEYFVAVFARVPHHSELSQYGVPQNRLRHVLNGGGRIGVEDHWFYLRPHKINTVSQPVDKP